jgi:LacI family transcriptional regulator
LNDKGRVGAEQRASVLAAVKALHYVPDISGRNLRLGRTESIGLLFYPSCARLFRNPFYAEVMEGLEEEFTKKRYNLLLAGYEISEMYAESPAQFLQGRVDAIVLLGGFPFHNIEQLSHHPRPLVLLDTDADELALDSVVSDGFNASRAIVAHLAELGHTRLLMAAYKMEDYNIDTRVSGFQKALQEHGLPHGPESLLREHLLNADVCADVLERMARADAPTAIYAVNDTLAFALNEALAVKGYRIPQDVSLVGFDDDEFSKDMTPALTTVYVDRRNLGQTGAELVFRRLAKPDAPTSKLRLPTRLVVRESTEPCKKSAGGAGRGSPPSGKAKPRRSKA